MSGIEDEELFNLLEEAKDMEGMSEEEAELLLEKLREKKITIDFSKVAQMLENDRKKEKLQKSDDLKKILWIVGKKWNPYDTFPEENNNYTFDEFMEIMQSIYHMKEKDDFSTE